MAYAMPAGSIVEVVMRCEATNQECLTVLHMKLLGGSTQPDGRASIVALLAKLSLAGGLFESWASCISKQVKALTMRAQMVYPTRYLPVDNVFGYPEGLVNDNFSSVNQAVAITRQGEKANRHNTGTIHMPGVPETFVQDSVITAAALAAYQPLAALMIADETVAGGLGVFQHVLYNRAAPQDSVDPVQWQVRRFARTMHRRSVGLGS